MNSWGATAGRVDIDFPSFDSLKRRGGGSMMNELAA
jgi:hypothetical protein